MRRALVLLVLWAACTKSPPASDAAPGLVPAAQFVTSSDGGATARTISVVLDQQPAGNRSLLAVSATEIERHGTPERFAQPNVACPNQIVASCLITNCTSLRDVISYPYGTVSAVAVGRVEVQGANRNERFLADGGTRPKVAQATSPLFASGEVLKVSVGGDVTPAFRRTLVVPRTVALVTPQVETAGTTITVNREAPFEVHWSPLPKGSPEVVAVSISDNVRTATCRFEASVGVAQVPKEVMAQLAPGPGFLTVHTLWAHDEAAEGWLVSVFARHVAVQRDGGTANFPTLDLE